MKRGTLVKEKDEDGTVYVLLDLDQTSPDGARTRAGDDQARARSTDQTAIEERTNELIAELRAQNEHLRSELAIRNEELRRKDTIIMTMAQRIPELEPAREAPSEPRESAETPAEGAEGVETPMKEERLSWWRRFFGS